MDTRGVVIAGTCPRCESTSEPTAERLITCARCGLRYDTHAKRMSAPPKRFRPYVPRSPFVVVDRSARELTLRFKRNPLEWLLLAFLVLGMGGGAIAAGIFVLRDRPDSFGLAVFWWVLSLLGLVPGIIIGKKVVVRVDADAVRADAFLHHPYVARGDLHDVVMQFWPEQRRRVAQYVIVAIDNYGASKVLVQSAFSDVAAQVLDEIDRALEEIPAIRSSSP